MTSAAARARVRLIPREQHGGMLTGRRLALREPDQSGRQRRERRDRIRQEERRNGETAEEWGLAEKQQRHGGCSAARQWIESLSAGLRFSAAPVESSCPASPADGGPPPTK